MTTRTYELIPIPGRGFGFVGKVPRDLAYEYQRAEYLELAAYYGAELAEAVAEREGDTFKRRVFASEEEAEAAADAWERATEAFKLPWVD